MMVQTRRLQGRVQPPLENHPAVPTSGFAHRAHTDWQDCGGMSWSPPFVEHEVMPEEIPPQPQYPILASPTYLLTGCNWDEVQLDGIDVVAWTC